MSDNPGGENITPAPDVNSTAIAIALSDTQLKTYLAYDGNYTILYAGPTTFETDHTSLKVTGVEIDTESHLYYVYVDVGNRKVAHIWSRPKRTPLPHGTS